MEYKEFQSYICTMIHEYDTRTNAHCLDETLQRTAEWADVGKFAPLGVLDSLDRKHWCFCSSAAFLLHYASVRNVYRYECVYGMLLAFDQNTGNCNYPDVLLHPEQRIGNQSFPFYASAAALLLEAHADIDNMLSSASTRKLQFHGFRSISEFEHECQKLGYVTKRTPYHRSGDSRSYFLLTVIDPHPTQTSCDSWYVFTSDETAEVLSGVIYQKPMFCGIDRCYLGKLAAYGFFPAS